MTNAELILRWAGGELDLMGWNESDYGDFLIETLADGTEWGNPQSVRRALRRFLLDGSVSVKEYDDNRTIPLKLRVKASDGAALAGGEAALVQMDSRRCELVYRAADEFAEPAVFVAVSVDLAHNMDDLGEGRLERFYTLTLECLPYALSDEVVSAPATAQGTSTPTLVDDCSSLTNWSAINATLGTTAGNITVYTSSTESPPGSPGLNYQVARMGSIDFSTEPYLAVDMSGAWYSTGTLEVLTTTWVTVPMSATDGGRAVYQVGSVAAIINGFRFSDSKPWGMTAATNRAFAAIYKQATPRTSASRQQVRVVQVPGSRRTSATMLVESPTVGLGTTIIYAGPAYDPSLGQSGVSPAITTDSARISGGYRLAVTGGSSIVYTRAANTFPKGDYVIWAMARVAGGSGGTLTVSMTASGATVTLPTLTLAPMADFAMIPLVSTSLPYGLLPQGSAANITFTLAWSSSTSNFAVDELMLFNVSDGNLTIVEAGSSRAVWIDPPSILQDAPSVFIGTGDKVTSRGVSMVSELRAWQGAAALVPPTSYLYVATSGTADSVVSASFRPAWHTHPAALT